MAAVTFCSDFGAQEDKVCHCFRCFPIYLPWSDETKWDQMPWSSFILMLSFKPNFSLWSFTFIKRLFSSSLLSAISAWHSVICISEVTDISPCNLDSSFHMMSSAFKLNKHGDNIQSHSFPNFEPIHCSMSSSNCWFLTCIQVSWKACKVVWYSHLFKNFPQFFVIHAVKGFSVVNETEVDVFLELSCFFDDAVDVGNLISGSSAFSKTSLNIWKFKVHVSLKPCLENFKHYFTSIWDDCKSLPQSSSVQLISVAQSCSTLCDPMNRSTPGLPVHHQLPEFTQTHVHRVRDAIQPSHPLSSPSPPAPNRSQHPSLFQWVNSLHEVAKVLELQL